MHMVLEMSVNEYKMMSSGQRSSSSDTTDLINDKQLEKYTQVSQSSSYFEDGRLNKNKKKKKQKEDKQFLI